MDEISRIITQEKQGSKYGLERTRALLNALGSPDDKLKIVHIAGTNGKGSTAEFVTRILIAAGKRVGTFTSPQVYSYTDKFKINGKKIKKSEINFYLEMVEKAAENFSDKPTAFEKETAAALSAFHLQGCEYAVIECGLGGLSDATNAINKKELAIILSIGLEHTSILGDTLKEISAQKAGIIKNCPAIVSVLQPEEALDYFKNLNGVTFAGYGLKAISLGISGSVFKYKGKKYAVKALGNAQMYNAACAIEAAEILEIDDKFILKGLKQARFAGRVQIIKKRDKNYVLDGSHNPASFQPLKDIAGVNYKNEKKTLIYGCLSDKDAESCLKELSSVFDTVICVTPNSYRAMDLQKISGISRKYFKNSSTEKGVCNALERAEGHMVAVCGSFTLLKEARRWINKRL